MGWLPRLSELVPIFLPSIFLPTAAEPVPDDCGPRTKENVHPGPGYAAADRHSTKKIAVRLAMR